MGLPGDAAGVFITLASLVVLALVILGTCWIVARTASVVASKLRRHRARERQEEAQGQFNEDSPLWPGV